MHALIKETIPIYISMDPRFFIVCYLHGEYCAPLDSHHQKMDDHQIRHTVHDTYGCLI